MGNKNSKKAPPEPTAPPLPLEVNPAVGVGLDEKDYGKPYRFLPYFEVFFMHTCFCSNADGEVIERRRSCTDILCFLIFVAFLVAWAGLGVFALSKGDISRFALL